MTIRPVDHLRRISVLWFFGKWGCTFCERARLRIPISNICGDRRYPATTGGAPVDGASDRPGS